MMPAETTTVPSNMVPFGTSPANTTARTPTLTGTTPRAIG